MRIHDEDFATELVFVATASGLSTRGAGGVRSAMARAAALLTVDAARPLDRPAARRSTPHAGGRAPSRRRTRRYAERRPHLVAS